MKKHLLISIRLTAVTMVFFGVIYPLFITGIAAIATDNGGKGKLLERDGVVYGFEAIGQSFTSDRYFHGRPSAVGYNAAATGGSNKGTSNPEYLAQVEARIAEFIQQNPGVKEEDIPVDLVTASGGGLDPHISPASARIQIARIARVRGLEPGKILELVAANEEKPLLGIFGPSKVNVLKLNLVLDQIK